MIRLSKQTHHWELDISCSQVEANLYSFVYATVAMNCSEEVWNSIFQEYTQESLQSKQRYLMKALASTFDVDIIKKLLTYTMGRSIEQLTNVSTGLLYPIYLPSGVPALGWTQAANLQCLLQWNTNILTSKFTECCEILQTVTCDI